MSRELFKNLQAMVAQQSPATQAILDVCESVTATFVAGLENCKHEMSFRAVTILPRDNDPEDLALKSDIDCYFTSIANNLKYDYPTVSEKFDLDTSTEKTAEGDTELWLHARRKFQELA